MIPENKARIVAAIAAPLFLLHAQPSCAQSAAAPAAAAAPAPAAMRIDPVVTQLPYISIATVGRGSPVVLIPGLATPREVWNGVLPELARHHRVYLVQVNGFGGDDPRANTGAGLLDGIVTDLSGYLASNHVAPAAVVGHSMGGLIGLMMARQHPAQVGRLMVVDALPFYGMLFGPQTTVAMVQGQGATMRDAIVAGYGHPADPAMVQRTAQGLAATPAAQAQVAGWAGHADPRSVGWAMYEDLTRDMRPDLAGIQTPVTMVFAKNRAGSPMDADPIYRGAYATLPHVTFVPVENTAHFIMLDQPQAFQAALMQFVGE